MRILFFSFLVFSFSFINAQQEDVARLRDEVNQAKSELRSLIAPQKYDGSKTTYYEVLKQNDFKDLEVVLFLRDSYSLHFSGKASGSKVRLRIYDKAPEDPSRIALHETKNISGKTVTVSSRELQEILSFHYENPNQLKSVFVEYEIMKGKPERGAIVMVLGY
jgi:hypothetical protein